MLISDIIFFHKKHHTILILIECCVLTIVSFFMAMLLKVEEWVVIDSYQQLSESYYTLAFGKFHNFVPFIFLVFELLSIVAITIIKNVLWKPIIAKKIVHVLFYLSLGIIVIDLAMTVLIPSEVYNSGIALTTISNATGKLISTICQLLMAFDIYCWREEFGLEKIYG